MLSLTWFLLVKVNSFGPGWEWLSRNAMFPLMVSFPLMRKIADWMCRVLKVSLGGKSSHSVRRQNSGELYPIDETIEVQPDFLRSFLPLLLLGMASVGFHSFFPVWEADIALPLRLASIGVLLFGVYLLCLAPFVWLNRNKPVLQVGEDGIAYSVRCGSRAGFIPWQQIESCELEVERTTFGTIIVQTFRLKDSNGKQLAALDYAQPYITRQHDSVAQCWLMIQKYLTGKFDESTVPPLDLVPPEPPSPLFEAPALPPSRIIERAPQSLNAEQPIVEPLVLPAGLNRYMSAFGLSIVAFIMLGFLCEINPLRPDSLIPATYDRTPYEGWPIWLIQSAAIFSFVGLIAFVVLATLWWRSASNPDLVIDDSGIIYRGTGALKPVVLKWEQIAACEVQPRRFLSSPLATLILLKDAGGKYLLKMCIDFNLEPANTRDARRVTDAIEQRMTGRVVEV